MFELLKVEEHRSANYSNYYISAQIKDKETTLKSSNEKAARYKQGKH